MTLPCLFRLFLKNVWVFMSHHESVDSIEDQRESFTYFGGNELQSLEDFQALLKNDEAALAFSL